MIFHNSGQVTGASLSPGLEEAEASSSLKRSTSGKVLEARTFYHKPGNTAPKFLDLNDRTLPDHLHDGCMKTMTFPSAPVRNSTDCA
ncbi:hypothetical protein TNCV_1592441 [Trichonephila clavipes]|nr:hypothetical protein TNCV_1592441 [Trichonephila clavipes]